jgi:hypothetical protein
MPQVKKSTTKEVAISSDITKLLAEAAALEKSNLSAIESGTRVPYIKCISKAEDAALDKNSPEYISKAVYKGFCVPESKLNLGLEFDFTVFGVFSVYEEKIKDESGGIPSIVGYVMPDTAKEIPLAEGSYFDREFTDNEGKTHLLSPIFWVFGLIKNYEEMGLHSLVFRSTAAANAKSLAKTLTEKGGMSCQYVFNVVSERKEFPKYNSVSYRPLFKETDRMNFSVKNGKIIPDEWSVSEIEEYVKMYHKLHEDYANSKMVSKTATVEEYLQLTDSRVHF